MSDPSAFPFRVWLTRAAGTGRAAGVARTARMAWLVLISAFALIDHVALSRLQATAGAHDGDQTELAVLQARMVAAERTVKTLQHQTRTVTPAMLEATRSSLLERLAPLEQFAKTTASKDDLAAVQDHLSALEVRLHRLKPSKPTARGGPVPIAAKAPEPPFAVLGVELRGGERFVSITPLPVSTLQQVRLVRVGDPVNELPGEWRLEALEGTTTVFRTEGHLVRINIP